VKVSSGSVGGGGGGVLVSEEPAAAWACFVRASFFAAASFSMSFVGRSKCIPMSRVVQRQWSQAMMKVPDMPSAWGSMLMMPMGATHMGQLKQFR